MTEQERIEIIEFLASHKCRDCVLLGKCQNWKEAGHSLGYCCYLMTLIKEAEK